MPINILFSFSENSFWKGSYFSVIDQYRWIAYLSIFIGCCFVCVFHLGTREPRFVTYVIKREMVFLLIFSS